MVSSNCFVEASADIIATTKSDYTVIEGCQRFDESLGDGSGSTDGSTAEGVRPQPQPPASHQPAPHLHGPLSEWAPLHAAVIEQSILLSLATVPL